MSSNMAMFNTQANELDEPILPANPRPFYNPFGPYITSQGA